MKVLVSSRIRHRQWLLIGFLALISAAFSLTTAQQVVSSQTKLTLADILTGLKSTKVTLSERNRLLTDAAYKRGVTFALTPEIERELRATGAGNELVNAIRQNGPRTVSNPTPVFNNNNSGSVEAYHKRADDLFNADKYAEAIVEFTRVIQMDPSRSLAYVRRGFSYNYLGDIDKAFRDYESAFKADPRLKNEEYMICIYYKTGDDPNYIINKCNETLNKYKNFSLALYKRGIAYRDIQEYDLALRDYTEAIRYYPNFSYAYNSRAVVHIDPKKNYSAAVSDTTTAIRIKSDFDSAYYNRGLAYFYLQNYDSSLSDFNRAIQLKPDDGDSHYYRGRIYYEQKNYAQAITNFSRAINIDAKDSLSYLYRGNCYYLQRDYQTAISDFTEAIRLKPSATMYRNRALAYEAMGRTDLANADRRRAQQFEQQ